MRPEREPEIWDVGDAYEAYIGRWSRHVADAFVRWLALPRGRRWLDVGCGTGALTTAVLDTAEPAEVVGVDSSAAFVAHARARIDDARCAFRVGDAQSLALADESFDAVVSGLALNFVPVPSRAVAEFARVTAAGGVVAAYVWDYAEGMAMLRHFWDAAVALDPEAAELDEGRRFPMCRPEPLAGLWADAGIERVTVEAIEVPMAFTGFEDYWGPFLGGQGPAPGYVMSLSDGRRDALRESLRERLPHGALTLTARAWAVTGTVRPDG